MKACNDEVVYATFQHGVYEKGQEKSHKNTLQWRESK